MDCADTQECYSQSIGSVVDTAGRIESEWEVDSKHGIETGWNCHHEVCGVGAVV